MHALRLLAVLLIGGLLAGCLSPSGGKQLRATMPDIPGGPTIKGSVTDENFVPISGALVEVTPGDLSALTDASGKFRFTDLEPGKYRVEASHKAWEAESLDVTIAEDETATVTLLMSPKIVPTPKKTTTEFHGVLTCAVVGAMGMSTESVSCAPAVASLGFAPGWVASVTEVHWENGTSSTEDTIATIRPASGTGLYAEKESASSVRIQLTPGVIDSADAGTVAPPAQGGAVLEIKKDPARLLTDLRLGVTVREEYHIYHTNFFGEVPPNIETFSARP